MTRRPPLVPAGRRPGGWSATSAVQPRPAPLPQNEICMKQALPDTLDANRFDEIVAASRPEDLWGAQAIAAAAGVCADTVRRSWSKLPGSPIRRVGGRFFVKRSRLLEWRDG